MFGAGREGRAMYAILLYLNANAKDCAVEETALQGTLSSIILMEIIMMIIVTSTASSHAANSSSSGSH